MGNHAESGDYLYFTYEYEKKYWKVYYNKHTGKAILSDDVLCGKAVTFDEQGNFWGTLEMSSGLRQSRSDKALEIIETIERTENNPVVVCYTMDT